MLKEAMIAACSGSPMNASAISASTSTTKAYFDPLVELGVGGVVVESKVHLLDLER
jgi:hypothetical protein